MTEEFTPWQKARACELANAGNRVGAVRPSAGYMEPNVIHRCQRFIKRE
jgi:hypothetical protein